MPNIALISPAPNSKPKSDMSSLLALPPEIRDSIIEQVLCCCRAPPTYPSTLGRTDFHDIDYAAWRSKTTIYHEHRTTHCPSNCLSLLLTSRQIHDETRAVLDRKKCPFVLDISVLNDYDLFPTWISIPCLTNRVRVLDVDVRLFGSIIPSKIARRLVGDGGRLGFHWSFYALLERFLYYGPVGEKKVNDDAELDEDGIPDYIKSIMLRSKRPNLHDQDITVEVLTLNFRSAEAVLPSPPANVGYDAWCRQHMAFHLLFQRRNDPGELEKYRTRPEWVAEYLLSEIENLLSMGYHHAAYGKILYERVGTIRIFSPEGVTEIDLASRLAQLQFTDPQYTFGHVRCEDRLPTFWKWKKQTLAHRQNLGFPVVWPNDPELKEAM